MHYPQDSTRSHCDSVIHCLTVLPNCMVMGVILYTHLKSVAQFPHTASQLLWVVSLIHLPFSGLATPWLNIWSEASVPCKQLSAMMICPFVDYTKEVRSPPSYSSVQLHKSRQQWSPYLECCDRCEIVVPSSILMLQARNDSAFCVHVTRGDG